MGILHNDGRSQHDTLRQLFGSIDYSKAIPPRYEQPGDDDPRITDDDNKLTGKLKAMVAHLIKADPCFDEQSALYYLLNHPHGRRMAEHMNSLTKKAAHPMNIMKLIEITETGLMAQVTKRDGESYAQSFSRKYENDQDFRKQWRDLTDAKQLQGYLKSLATLTPTSTESGSSSVSDDTKKAYDQAMALAEELHRQNPTKTVAQHFAQWFQENPAMAQQMLWHSAATPT